MGHEPKDFGENSTDYEESKYGDIFDQSIDENGHFIPMDVLCENIFPTERSLVIVESTSLATPKVIADEKANLSPEKNNGTSREMEEAATNKLVPNGPREVISVPSASQNEAVEALGMLGKEVAE